MQWINANGLIIICIMMIPNIVYATEHKGEENKCKNILMNIVEQIGRYGTLFLMIFNIGIFEKGAYNDIIFYIWLGVAYLLLVVYMFVWAEYFKCAPKQLPLSLAIVPCILFILTGILLRHYLLIVFGTIFTIGHCYVTIQNNKED